MPVLDAVQTFAGITNDNEFYSHHYLAEVFGGDIQSRLEAWDTAAGEGASAPPPAAAPGGAAAADATPQRTPPKALAACAQRWFTLRGQLARARSAAEKWALFTEAQAGLLQALGYPAPDVATIPLAELVPGSPIPVWQLVAPAGLVGAAALGRAPQLAIVPAYQPGAEDEELLDHCLTDLHYAGLPVPPALARETWASLVGARTRPV